MTQTDEDRLVVAVSSRALFDLDDAHAVYDQHGVAAYRAYQREHEQNPLPPGTGFALVRGLLAINQRSGQPLVDVVVLSRNDADTGVRIMHSAEHHHLDVQRYAFTAGREAWPYLDSFRADLFLSADTDDVHRAASAGYAAARVLDVPGSNDDSPPAEVRVAFDGDAVLFDATSETVFQQHGLEAFLANEQNHADVALGPGPLKGFLDALLRINARFPDDEPAIRVSLVTARSAAAHHRVITTLRSWGVVLHETFFLGGASKAEVLRALRPHIFFDDQTQHLLPASRITATGHVPTTYRPDDRS